VYSRLGVRSTVGGLEISTLCISENR